MATIDLRHLKITVKLDEAVDPTSKLQLRGLLTRLNLDPAFIGSPQPTSREWRAASARFDDFRALNRFTSVASKDILQHCRRAP